MNHHLRTNRLALPGQDLAMAWARAAGVEASGAGPGTEGTPGPM